MNRPGWRLHLAAFVTGLFLVPARILLMFFFPIFNLGDVLLFASAAALLAYCFGARPSWGWVASLFLPACLFLLLVLVAWVGVGNLRRGIGVGHVVSLALIPLSTLVGAHYGSRLAGGDLKVRL